MPPRLKDHRYCPSYFLFYNGLLLEHLEITPLPIPPSVLQMIQTCWPSETLHPATATR